MRCVGSVAPMFLIFCSYRVVIVLCVRNATKILRYVLSVRNLLNRWQKYSKLDLLNFLHPNHIHILYEIPSKIIRLKY